jgi:hypothetical protein
MTKVEQFFFNHAGYSWDAKAETEHQGKLRCARELARAERYAAEHEWSFEWTPDLDADASFVETWEPAERDEWNATEHECFVCLVHGPLPDCEVLASCGGIFDPSAEYSRVMEAELASEALADIEREERNAAECARLLES